MNHSLTRRSFIGSALLLPALGFAPRLRAEQQNDDIDKRLAALEARIGGRLGVSVLDSDTNVSFGYRGR